jgi:FkbM family methyltransferase
MTRFAVIAATTELYDEWLREHPGADAFYATPSTLRDRDDVEVIQLGDWRHVRDDQIDLREELRLLNWKRRQRTSQHSVRKPDATSSEPLTKMSFRDGRPFFHRGATDLFIIREQPYKLLPIHGVTLDLGAHIGTFTRDALAAGAERVVAYEPDPRNFVVLRKNTTGFSVKLSRKAVAGDAGKRPMWLCAGSGGSGSTLFGQASNRPVITVRTEPFRDIVKRIQPMTVKVDIKDAEREIDWDSDLDDCVQSLAVECGADYCRTIIAPALQRRGFRLVKPLRPKGWRRDVGIWCRLVTDSEDPSDLR